MNSDVADTTKIPHVLLIYLNADQVRHDVGQPIVVVPFHPHHFNSSLGIRQFANVTEELPMFFLEAAEIEVAKDVSQKDQSGEGNPL